MAKSQETGKTDEKLILCSWPIGQNKSKDSRSGCVLSSRALSAAAATAAESAETELWNWFTIKKQASDYGFVSVENVIGESVKESHRY